MPSSALHAGCFYHKSGSWYVEHGLLVLHCHRPSTPGGGAPGTPVPSSSFAATAHANNNDLPEKRANNEEDCAELKASTLGASPALEPTM